MNKISFIVPIYNTDIRKLKKCISSIQRNVGLESYEINLIDDGSKEEHSKEYRRLVNSRIAYFYKSNGGVSSARNMGIEKSNGEYLCFVDSDDLLVGWNDASEELDMVVYDIAFTSEKNVISLPFERTNLTVNTFYSQLVKNSILNAVYGKLFKKSFLEKYHIRFNENLVHGEDLNFLLEIMTNHPKIVYIPKCIYLYTYNAQTTNSRFKKQPFKILDNYIYNFNREFNLVKQYQINIQIFNERINTVVKDLFNLYLVNVLMSDHDSLRIKIIAFLKSLDNPNLAGKIRLFLLKSGNSILIPLAVIRNGYLKIKH